MEVRISSPYEENKQKNAEPQYFTAVLEIRKRKCASLHENNDFLKIFYFKPTNLPNAIS